MKTPASFKTALPPKQPAYLLKLPPEIRHLRLIHGVGDFSKGEACVMSAAVAMYRVEHGVPLGTATDSLGCICPILRSLVIIRNDRPWTSDEARTAWGLALVPQLLNTWSKEATLARAHEVGAWICRDLIAPLVSEEEVKKQLLAVEDLTAAAAAFKSLDRAIARAFAHDRAHDRARAHARAFARAHAHALAIDHDRALARALEIALALALDHDRAHDRAHALAHASAHDRAIDHALALAHALASASALAFDQFETEFSTKLEDLIVRLLAMRPEKEKAAKAKKEAL